MLSIRIDACFGLVGRLVRLFWGRFARLRAVWGFAGGLALVRGGWVWVFVFGWVAFPFAGLFGPSMK